MSTRKPRVGDVVILEKQGWPDVAMLGVVAEMVRSTGTVSKVRLLGDETPLQVAEVATVYRVDTVPADDLNVAVLEAHEASCGVFTSWGAALEFITRPQFRRTAVRS